MDREQFNRWLKNHATKFTGISEWMKTFKGDGEAAVASKAVVEEWFKVLADVRIDDAIWASDLMFKGDVALPFGYDQHPQTIRRYALTRANERKSAGKRYKDGERVYDCGKCCDRGIVVIWSRAFLLWASEAFADVDLDVGPALGWFRWREDPRAESRKRGIAISGGVACNCPAGAGKVEHNSDLLRFDPARMVVYDEWQLGDAIKEIRRQESKVEF